MKIINGAVLFLFLLLPGLAWGQTCSSTGSGPWSDAATWDCGVVPLTFANYSVAVVKNGHNVTITDNRTIPRTQIGDAATDSTNAALTLQTGVSVTLAGNVTIRGGTVGGTGRTASLIQGAGTTLDLATYAVWQGYFESGNYVSGTSGTAAARSVWTITGAPGNRATVRGSAGSFIDYVITSTTSGPGTINWQYADFTGIDHGANANRIQGIGGGITVSNCTFKNMASILFGYPLKELGSAGNSIPHTVQYTDFRNITARSGNNSSSYHWRWNLQGLAYAQIVTSHCTFANGDGSGKTFKIFHYAGNAAVSYNVFYNCIITGGAGYADNVTWEHNLFYHDYSSDFVLVMSGVNNQFRYNGYIAIDANTHGIATGTTTSPYDANTQYVSHNFFQASSQGSNPFRMGGSNNTIVQNNIFLGYGSGISNTVSNFNYSPTWLYRNNTFAIQGSIGTLGSGSTGYMQEDTGGSVDTAYTTFSSNLFLNTATTGPSSVFSANSNIPNQINRLAYNAYYDPSSYWQKFYQISISSFTQQGSVVASPSVAGDVYATPTTTSSFKIYNQDLTSRYMSGAWLRITLANGVIYQANSMGASLSGADTVVTINHPGLTSALGMVEYAAITGTAPATQETNTFVVNTAAVPNPTTPYNKFTVTTGGNLSARYYPGAWLEFVLADGKRYRAQVSLYTSATGAVTINLPLLTQTITAIYYGGTLSSATVAAGSGDFGQTDLAGNTDPRIANPKWTLVHWATAKGASGTDTAKLTWIAQQLIKANGLAVDGTAATAAGYTVDDIWSDIQFAMTPRNATLQIAGEGGTYIGAVMPVPIAPNVWQRIFKSLIFK